MTTNNQKDSSFILAGGKNLYRRMLGASLIAKDIFGTATVSEVIAVYNLLTREELSAFWLSKAGQTLKENEDIPEILYDTSKEQLN